MGARVEMIVDRLVNEQLLLSLLGLINIGIKDLEVISSRSLDTEPIRVSLIERLFYASPIVHKHSSVVHQLNRSVDEAS